MDTEADFAPEPIFRPVKRRKFTRRRPDDDSDAAGDLVSESNEQERTVAPSHATDDNDAQSEDNVNILRFRRLQHPRRGGIAFSAASRFGKDGNRQTALGPVGDPEKEQVQAMRDRFTGHTGQTVDVDRHMMAYIDSEMAKRYQRSPAQENQASAPSELSQASSGQVLSGQQLDREPASLGKLHEIDLGQETRLQNIARTEAATRRLVDDEDPTHTGQPAPATLATEKPFRRRKRRTSADMERDRLVEEVLRESKLGVYDEPEDEPQPDDQAADDRIAEHFRQEFMDAIQSRRRLTKMRTTKTDKTEPPKGPKLGGSRSARAAMRDTQTKPAPR